MRSLFFEKIFSSFSRRKELERENEYLKGKVEELSNQVEELSGQAYHDSLTGVLNRRGIEKMLEIERGRRKRYKSTFSIIFFDINGLKAVNDNQGYEAGDKLIKKTAEAIRDNVRAVDHVGRFGGDEFLVILPETSFCSTITVKEKLKRKLGEENVSAGAGRNVKEAQENMQKEKRQNKQDRVH